MVSLGSASDSSQIIATINLKSRMSSWFVTARGSLVSICGGVEQLTSPLVSGNHAESSLVFVDFEVA